MSCDILFVTRHGEERQALIKTLTDRGHRVSVLETHRDVLAAGAPGTLDVAIVDMECRDALKTLRELKEQAGLPVVAIAPPTPELAEGALRLGVADIVPRPVDPATLVDAVSNAAELARVASESPPFPQGDENEPVSGTSPAMKVVRESVRRVAQMRCNVLVLGERGTGRDMVVDAIHNSGLRAAAPLATVECATATAAELEHALSPPRGDQGLTEGATHQEGALHSRRELYLRNLHELPPSIQLSLDRVLAQYADSTVLPTRLIASATPEIYDLVTSGAFRPDLLDRLTPVRIELLPLRYRAQDIPLLATSFLKEACRREQIPLKTFSPSALRVLSALPWLGNAIELRAFADQMAALKSRGVILEEDVLTHVRFGAALAGDRHRGPLRKARESFERDYVSAVLRRHRGRIGEAAKELGIRRTNLYRKMRQLRIRDIA